MPPHLVRLPASLVGPRPWPWLRALVFDWAVIVGAALVARYVDHVAVYALAAVVIGNRQHALGLLGHDGAHLLIARNRALNDFLGNFFAMLPVGITVQGYRAWHLPHHQYLGGERDPELPEKATAKGAWDVPFRVRAFVPYLLTNMALGPLLPWMIHLTVLWPKKWTHRLLPFAFVGTVVALAWRFDALWFVAQYYGAFPAFGFFFVFRRLLEHVGSQDTWRLRTTFLEAVLFAPHQTTYHWEHHRWPYVAFTHLREARDFEAETPVVTVRELFAAITAPKMKSADTVTARRGNRSRH